MLNLVVAFFTGFVLVPLSALLVIKVTTWQERRDRRSGRCHE